MNAAALIIYGIGHFGKSLLWSASALIFSFYLTEVAGFTPTAMSIILAISLVFNAGSDFAVGRFLNKRITTLWSAARIQILGAAISGAAFVLFAQTGIINEISRSYYALTALIMFRLGYSLYDVPQNSMLGLIAGGDSDRSQLTAVRYIAAGCATIIITVFLAFWLGHTDNEARDEIFVQLAISLFALSFSTALLVALYFSRSHAVDTGRVVEPLASMPAPISTLPLILAFGSICIYSGLMPIFTKLQAYYVVFALPSLQMAPWFLLIAAIGQIVAQPFWVMLGRIFTLRQLHLFAALSVIFAGAVFGVFAQADTVKILASAFVFGAASSGLLMSIWTVMASIASANKTKALANFGLFTCCSKLAQALSIVLIGVVLTSRDYRSGSADALIFAMTAAVIATGSMCLILGVREYCRR